MDPFLKKKFVYSAAKDFIGEVNPKQLKHFDALWDEINDNPTSFEIIENAGNVKFRSSLRGSSDSLVGHLVSVEQPILPSVIATMVSAFSSNDALSSSQILTNIETFAQKFGLTKDFTVDLCSRVEKAISDHRLTEDIIDPEGYVFNYLPDPLRRRARAVRDCCEREMEYVHSQGLFRFFTSHGIAHSKRVLKFITEIIKEGNLSLEPYELYLLFICAYAHDIGMIGRSGEDLDSEAVCIEVRKNHAFRSYEYILDKWHLLGVQNEREAIIVANLCAAHSSRFNIMDLVEQEDIFVDEINKLITVRVRLLAAVLRFADALDLGERRLPPVAYREHKAVPLGQHEHYFKHEAVENIKLLGNNIFVMLKIKYKYPENIDVITIVRDELAQEYNSVVPIFRQNNCAFEFKFNTVKSFYLKDHPIFKEGKFA